MTKKATETKRVTLDEIKERLEDMSPADIRELDTYIARLSDGNREKWANDYNERLRAAKKELDELGVNVEYKKVPKKVASVPLVLVWRSNGNGSHIAVHARNDYTVNVEKTNEGLKKMTGDYTKEMRGSLRVLRRVAKKHRLQWSDLSNFILFGTMVPR